MSDAVAAARDLRFRASESSGDVSALLLRPADATCLLVLAHGAGAGMRHAFMEAIAERLFRRGVATLRYQFPYVEQGRRAPSPRPILLATVRAAIAAAHDTASDLPLLAGGKSMGGRMTSMAMADADSPSLRKHVRGVAFLGFPLHAPGKPTNERAEHLQDVPVPMLFVQGTRDSLADLELLEPVCRSLGERARLHVVEGGDHSFQVLKRSGRNAEEVLDEIGDAFCAWARAVV